MSDGTRARIAARVIPVPADPDPETRQRIATAFARCFGGADGGLVLGYLRAMTIERVLGAQASDAALRQLEGQRQLIHSIETMIDRGATGSSTGSTNVESA